MDNLVKVYQPYNTIDTGEFRPATVNWSAIGDVDTYIARKFAQELLDACDEADRLNEEFLRLQNRLF